MASTTRSRTFMVVLDGHWQLQEIEEQLSNIPQIKYYIGQKETNNDGDHPHYQLVLGFKNAKTINTVIAQTNSVNVEHVRDIAASIRYCTKESHRIGDIISWGEIPAKHESAANKLIQDALLQDTVEGALNVCEEQDTIFYIHNEKALIRYFNMKMFTGDKSLYAPELFNRALETDFSKTIVLIGQSGFGKTQYALAHFKCPLHIRDRQDYSRFCNQVDGLVYDDLNTANWAPLTFLKLLETETAVTHDIKYGSCRIPANFPRIVCANHEDVLWPANTHPATKEAMQNRMRFIFINGPLFNTKRKHVHNVYTYDHAKDCTCLYCKESE